MTIGQQTGNDFYQDSMEESRLEVVKSSPATVSLQPNTESDETATFSGPPAKKLKREKSHIADQQTSSQQVSSPYSTRMIKLTKKYCSQHAPSGRKGKGPGKGNGKTSSLSLRPIQTTQTVTVKTKPPDTGYSAWFNELFSDDEEETNLLHRTKPPDTGYSATLKEEFSEDEEEPNL
ncbi:uncharacterized protein LOC128243746 [Mya arenaria]|uniref:uncharacterized protein LOC128243746 n=1 Tax=Mya arenaria TaxID=6604 RepID=UPI0022E906FA|nr:uncharacterized protein LOC128243746 [Mya arenaria]